MVATIVVLTVKSSHQLRLVDLSWSLRLVTRLEFQNTFFPILTFLDHHYYRLSY